MNQIYKMTMNLVEKAHAVARDTENEKARRSLKKACVAIVDSNKVEKVLALSDKVAAAADVNKLDSDAIYCAFEAIGHIAKRGDWSALTHRSEAIRCLFIDAVSLAYCLQHRTAR